MKTFALLFTLVCSSVALLEHSAEAATPRPLNLKQFQVGASKISNPGNKVMLNPQPLPPRYLTPYQRFNPGAKVMLNPQPLPPRFKTF